MTLVFVTMAWAAGIIAAQAGWLELPWFVWAAGSCIMGGAAWFTPTKEKLPLQRDPLQFSLVLAAVFLLGAAALTWRTRPATTGDLHYYNDQGWVTVEGIVVGSPDLRDNHINLRVRVDTLETTSETYTTHGDLLARVDYGDVYRHGDRIRLRGEMRTPPEFAGFDYRDYLAREGVYSYMDYGIPTHTGERTGSVAQRAIFDFRQAAHAQIVTLLPEPTASLLSGILLGIESGISEDTRAAFNAVGATHVIAISGANMVVLGGLVKQLGGRFLDKRWTAAITIGVIVIYTIFVGADGAVRRAAFMVCAAVIGDAFVKRKIYTLATLAFTVMFMSILNPLVLWDVGFQLSFLATLGLILYVEPLSTGLMRLLEHLTSAERAQQMVSLISEVLIVTIAAQITTAPLIAYYFGRLSLLSFPVNLLIIPAQPPVMVLGGLGVALSFLIEPVGQLVLWAAYVFVGWTASVVTFFAQLGPDAPSTFVGLREMLTIYAVMFGATALAKSTYRDRLSWLKTLAPQVAAGGMAVMMVLLFVAGCSQPDGYMHVRYLDTGENPATLITSPTGRTVLIDTGSSGRTLSTELGRVLPFWQRHIDVVILTQNRSAYVDSLRAISRRYEIGALVTNGSFDDDLQQVIDEHRIPVVIAQTGTVIQMGDGVRLTIADAPPQPPPPDELGEPIIVHLAYGDARHLFTGALAEEQLTRLDAALQDVTVLQIPRGGHRDVTTVDLLTMTSPQFSIVQINAGNRFGLPHTEALSRLSDYGGVVQRTDIDGTIHVWTDGQQLWVKPTR